MNLYEKLALMASAAALTVLTAVGAAMGQPTPDADNPSDLPEATSPAQEEDSESDAALAVLPPFAENGEDEVMEYLPGRPGFMRPAFADDEDPVLSVTTDATDAPDAPDAPDTSDAPQDLPPETAGISATTQSPAPAPVETVETTEAEVLPEVTPPPAAPEVTTAPVTTRKPQTADPKPAPKPDTSDLLQSMIAVAKSQVGVEESEPNNVKYNTWYYGHEVRESSPSGRQYAWCAVFLSWCADQSGIGRSVFPHTASVSYLHEFYENQGLYFSRSRYTPKAGDIVFFQESHVGLVVEVSDSQVRVVEGNYSDGVALNTYPISSPKLTGYATPEY